MKFNLGNFLATILAIGESLEPVYIHNAKSQTVATILTTDANALVQQILASQGTSTTTSTPVQAGTSTGTNQVG